MSYDPDEALKLKNQVCFPLYAAARRVVSMYTYTQYITFMVLWEKDGLSVSEICSRLQLDSGTVTPLLKKMEAEGWVERKRSADDERRVEVYLTGAGRAMKKKVAEVPLKVGSCFHMESEHAQQLYELLYEILGTEE